jgi:hypothetical protein
MEDEIKTLAASVTSLAEATVILAETAATLAGATISGEPGGEEDLGGTTAKTTKKKAAKKKASRKKAAAATEPDDLADLLGDPDLPSDKTIDDVRQAMLSYLEGGTQKDARAILKKLKATKLGELAEDMYGAAVSAFELAKEALG